MAIFIWGSTLITYETGIFELKKLQFTIKMDWMVKLWEKLKECPEVTFTWAVKY